MVQSAQVWMPYFASTMAIVIAIFVAAWLHNKHIDLLTAAQFNARIGETNQRIAETNQRIDETNRRIGETNQRIDEILAILRDLDRRVTRLEERSVPLVRS